MKIMVIVKATQESEAGRMPSEQELREMGQYNEQLVKAGLMLTGDGLHPSKKGKRIDFSSGKPLVLDGPFAETKELIAGYWLWQVNSLDEAVEWARKAPFKAGQLELRPIFETADFGDALTPELLEQEARLRAELAARRG